MPYHNTTIDANTAQPTLKGLRKSVNKIQREVAADYGIEERTLRRWENDEHCIRLHDYIGLLALYGYKLKLVKEDSE